MFEPGTKYLISAPNPRHGKRQGLGAGHVRSHWRFGAGSMIPNSCKYGVATSLRLPTQYMPINFTVSGRCALEVLPLRIAQVASSSLIAPSRQRWLGSAVAGGKPVRPLHSLIPEAALLHFTRQHDLKQSKLDPKWKKPQLRPSCCSRAGHQGTRSAIK